MKKIIIIAAVVIIAGAGAFAMSNAPTKTGEQPQISVTPSMAPANEETVTYTGKEGVDALTLLKENNTAEQNASGLVTTINNRKAEDSKKEYWAFYVNGKMAEVGPGEYVTKDTDKIEWKVENY